MNGKRPGGWVALAWRYYRDPKFSRVSDAAELLYVRGLATAGEHETDGELSRDMLRYIAPRRQRSVASLAAQLVRAGLWIETADGYAVPLDTWSRWQETAEQRAAARARNAERKAKWRARHGGTDPRTDPGTEKSVPRHQGQGQGQGTPYGVPPAPPHPAMDFKTWVDERGILFAGPLTNGAAEPEPEP